MNGSKIIRMTSEELRAMRERGELPPIAPMPEGFEPDTSDPDNPDCSQRLRAMLDEMRKPGRPKAEKPKVYTGIRLDADVLGAFKTTGKGWQTRINDALKDWLKTHRPA